jgi:hypothetical protein
MIKVTELEKRKLQHYLGNKMLGKGKFLCMYKMFCNCEWKLSSNFGLTEQ